MNHTENHPPDGPFTDRERADVDEGAPPTRRPDSLPREDRQFSLRELMLATTFVAIGTAGVRSMPGPIFAGVVGGATLVILLGLAVFAPNSRVLRLAWWSLFALYLGAAAGAVYQTWHIVPPLWEP